MRPGQRAPSRAMPSRDQAGCALLAGQAEQHGQSQGGPDRGHRGSGSIESPCWFQGAHLNELLPLHKAQWTGRTLVPSCRGFWSGTI